MPPLGDYKFASREQRQPDDHVPIRSLPADTAVRSGQDGVAGSMARFTAKRQPRLAATHAVPGQDVLSAVIAVSWRSQAAIVAASSAPRIQARLTW